MDNWDREQSRRRGGLADAVVPPPRRGSLRAVGQLFLDLPGGLVSGPQSILVGRDICIENVDQDGKSAPPPPRHHSRDLPSSRQRHSGHHARPGRDNLDNRTAIGHKYRRLVARGSHGGDGGGGGESGVWLQRSSPPPVLVLLHLRLLVRKKKPPTVSPLPRADRGRSAATQATA